MTFAGFHDISTPQDIDALSEPGLRSVLMDRLQGKDFRFHTEHDVGDLPHIAISRIYSAARYPLQARLRYAISGFIREIAEGQRDGWPDDAVGRLLMLCDPVLLDADSRDSVCLQIRRICATGGPLRLAAYQALATLRYRAEPEFWTTLYKDDRRCLPIILAGLAVNDVSSPIRWVATLKWTEDVEAAFIGSLPGLLDAYPPGSVVRCLAEVLPEMAGPAARAIRQFCREEGLTLPEDRPRPIYCRRYGLVSTLFLIAILMAQATVLRAWRVSSEMDIGWTMAGTCLIGLTYIIAIVLTEVYGFKRARRAVWRVLLVAGLFCGLSGWAASLPVRQGFVVGASLVAVAIGGFTSVILLEWSHRRLPGYGRDAMSIRIIRAGVVGHAVDSILFFPAAFWGSRFHGIGMVSLGFLVKVAMLVLLLPLVKIIITRLLTEEDVYIRDPADAALTPFALDIDGERYAHVSAGQIVPDEFVLVCLPRSTQSDTHPQPGEN